LRCFARLLERGVLDFGQGQKGWIFSRVLARDVAKDQVKPYWEKENSEESDRKNHSFLSIIKMCKLTI
jgi:hypothetical protein